MLEFIFISVVIGLLYLVILTVAAILAAALEYLSEADEVLIVAPEASAELERIAQQKGAKRHKRFVYDRKSKESVLVESDRIDDELKGQDLITVDVR